MKKLITNIYYTLLLILLSNTIINAQQLTITSKTGCTNDTITIPINSTAITSLAALTVYVSFDTTVLKYVSFINVNSQLPGLMSGQPIQGSGAWDVALSWVDNTLSGINLAANKIGDMRFVYKGGSTNISVVPSLTELANIAGNTFNTTYVNGTASSTVITTQPLSNNTTCESIPTSKSLTGATGTTFVWQNYSGSQWNNVTAGTSYSGVTTNTLQILLSPFSLNNAIYRCKVIGTCTDYSAPTTLTIYQKPAVVITHDTTLCSGNSVIISGLGSTGYGTLVYSWNNGLGTGITKTVSPITNTSYILTITDGRNCSNTATENITISAIPANAGAISGATDIVQGQNNITYTVPAIANATSYIWTLPPGMTGTSSTNSITLSAGQHAYSGNITVKGTNTCGLGSTSSLFIKIPKRLVIKLIVQGYYNIFTNTMDKTQDMDGDHFTGAICDSISVSLAQASNPYTIIKTFNTTFDTTGITTTINVPGTDISPYFIIINTRNTIETWSSVPVSFNTDSINYDFTNDVSKAFGDNLIQVSTNKFAAYSGDISGILGIKDGIINIWDLEEVFNAMNDITGTLDLGYVISDITGNANVDIIDLSKVFDNVNLGVVSSNPNTVK